MAEIIEESIGEVCPACGCQLGESPYKDVEVYYCCEPCATGGACDCGCCKVVPKEEVEPVLMT